MKAFALIVVLLVSIAFLGCVQEQAPKPAPGEGEPAAVQSFESEGEAFNALEDELAGVEDLSMEELEQALQE